MMILTAHAKERIRQRGLSTSMLDYVWQHGVRRRNHLDTEVIILKHDAYQTIRSEIEKLQISLQAFYTYRHKLKKEQRKRNFSSTRS